MPVKGPQYSYEIERGKVIPAHLACCAIEQCGEQFVFTAKPERIAPALTEVGWANAPGFGWVCPRHAKRVTHDNSQ